MPDESEVITKTSEIFEKVWQVDHTVSNGESLLIGVRDTSNNTKILLEVKAGALYEIRLKGNITDKKIL